MSAFNGTCLFYRNLVLVHHVVNDIEHSKMA